MAGLLKKKQNEQNKLADLSFHGLVGERRLSPAGSKFALVRLISGTARKSAHTKGERGSNLTEPLDLSLEEVLSSINVERARGHDDTPPLRLRNLMCAQLCLGFQELAKQ